MGGEHEAEGEGVGAVPRARRPEKSLGDARTFRAGYAHVRSADLKLRPILDALGVLKFKPEGEPFESLVESILSQQVAGPAASAIIRRVRALFPDGELQPKSLHNIDARKLRAAGASPQKLSYLKDLAARVVEGSLDLEALESMSDEKIMEVLDEVRGIGPWTVHMFLIFTLGRPDVLPVDDLGIRKSAQRIYGLSQPPKKADIEKVAEKWRPYRTVASLYLWHARDNEG
jgi:3-methyladenine DNA glycosylase/8-oxoguanine DNA glycosylase